jgi:hypothetical protein
MRSESRNRLNAAVVEIFMNLLAAAWGRAGVIRPHGAEPSDNDGHYQSWPFLKPPHVAIMRKRHRANELA